MTCAGPVKAVFYMVRQNRTRGVIIISRPRFRVRVPSRVSTWREHPAPRSFRLRRAFFFACGGPVFPGLCRKSTNITPATASVHKPPRAWNTLKTQQQSWPFNPGRSTRPRAPAAAPRPCALSRAGRAARPASPRAAGLTSVRRPCAPVHRACAAAASKGGHGHGGGSGAAAAHHGGLLLREPARPRETRHDQPRRGTARLLTAGDLRPLNLSINSCGGLRRAHAAPPPRVQAAVQAALRGGLSLRRSSLNPRSRQVTGPGYRPRPGPTTAQPTLDFQTS